MESSVDSNSTNRSEYCRELEPTVDFTLFIRVNNCIGIYDPCLNVCHYNYTSEYGLQDVLPIDFALPIYGIVFPILLIFLVIANIFVVLVLSKKHMASPTNTVLLYMAISEFFVGLVPFPFTFFYYTLGYHKSPELHETWWCYMYHYLMTTLPPICHGVAIWLTVLLAAQRYVYIQYPVAAQKWCTIPHVKQTAFVLTVLSIMSGILKTFEVTYVIYDGYVAGNYRNLTRIAYGTFCASKRTSVVHALGINVFYNLYMWPRVIGFLLLPSVLLIILNVLLIVGLRAAQERRNRLLKENRQREANRQKDSNSTNLMLILIVSIFLIVNLPQAVFLALLSFDSTFDLEIPFFNTNNYSNLFVMIDNMLIMASYPVNFAIYCSMSTQFRETFKRIFFRSLPPMPTRQGSVMITNNASYMRLPLNGTKFPTSSSKRKQPPTAVGGCRTKYGTEPMVTSGCNFTQATVISNPQQEQQQEQHQHQQQQQQQQQQQHQTKNTLTNGALKVEEDANSQDDLL